MSRIIFICILFICAVLFLVIFKKRNKPITPFNDHKPRLSNNDKVIYIVSEDLLIKKDLSYLRSKWKKTKECDMKKFYDSFVLPHVDKPNLKNNKDYQVSGAHVIVLTNKSINMDILKGCKEFADVAQSISQWQFISTVGKDKYRIIKKLMDTFPNYHIYLDKPTGLKAHDKLSEDYFKRISYPGYNFPRAIM